ncbi:hypothetical protein FAEPRAA2165_01284 [Faecalibacterium duncaniae]|uniref:Uncharacterized protein n=1 Tax=Faecalibacterium duncaniae (strain DSM 17677 / JCM 31915 / A2-165) TaxID=411483 RepID=C7H4R9_FAED2|nr:hypothetical protein FAEPRAA2165_01284 [Faecalibacterium duncaniae]
MDDVSETIHRLFSACIITYMTTKYNYKFDKNQNILEIRGCEQTDWL